MMKKLCILGILLCFLLSGCGSTVDTNTAKDTKTTDAARKVLAEDIEQIEEDTKSEKNTDKPQTDFRKNINIDLPSDFELGEYIEGLEADSRAIGGLPIYANEVKNKLEDEAINEEWNDAGLILVWDHSRFAFDNEDIAGMVGGMHAEVTKKPENIETESGNLISFEIEKDLYTAAGQAELKKRGIETDYTACMTGMIVDCETDSDYVYAAFFNQKYFDEETSLEIAKSIRIN